MKITSDKRLNMALNPNAKPFVPRDRRLKVMLINANSCFSPGQRGKLDLLNREIDADVVIVTYHTKH